MPLVPDLPAGSDKYPPRLVVNSELLIQTLQKEIAHAQDFFDSGLRL